MRKGSKHKPETILKFSLMRKGRPLSELHIAAIRKSNCGNRWASGKRSKEARERMIIASKNRNYIYSIEVRKKRSEMSKRLGLRPPVYKGSEHYRWIKDRTLLKKQDRRNDPAYYEWRKQAWVRDNYKCRMVNQECNGRIEAHHILGWSSYPELRYNINNGITLCHAHHPRKRAEEKRLVPIFQGLVSVSK